MKKSVINKSEIARLNEVTKNLPIKALLNRVEKVTNQRKRRSLEQKIIALKLLQLNDMQFTKTGRQVCVTRKTLWAWWKEYGEIIQNAAPEYEIIENIETDLAILHSDTMKKAYNTISKGLSKFNQLINQASTTRHIYPVKEALLATVEVLKLQQEKPAEKDDDEYMNKLMEKLIGDKDGN